jgi:hypothetical protein
MNILAGTNPNEDEPQLGPGAASSGTGAIDVYYFHNTETGELRLYGTPGLVRAQAAQEQYAKTGSPDVLRHGALPPGMAPETEPAGVREERRAGAKCMIIAPKRLKLRLSGSARKSQKRFRDTPMFKFPAVLARTQPFLSRSVEKRGDQSRFKCRKMDNYYAIRSSFRAILSRVQAII